jgi:hypothetical protein
MNDPARGGQMAILIDMSKDHGLQVDQPTECTTDVERGLSVKIKPGPVIECHCTTGFSGMSRIRRSSAEDEAR